MHSFFSFHFFSFQRLLAFCFFFFAIFFWGGEGFVLFSSDRLHCSSCLQGLEKFGKLKASKKKFCFGKAPEPKSELLILKWCESAKFGYTHTHTHKGQQLRNAKTRALGMMTDPGE